MSMKNYREFAVDLAKQAGAIMRQNFTLGMKREWKGDGTPLTTTDSTINQLVLDAIKKEYPEHGVIAEEGNNYNEQEYVWVCDPVDGTIPFSHGMPVCMFLLALVKNGVSVLGVAYDPFMDRMYVAERGHGATVNGTTLSVSKSPTLKNALVALEGRKISGPINLAQALLALEEQGALVMRPFSFGYDAMLVAHGQSVAAFMSATKPWDYAAPSVIIEEAGGRCTDLYGEVPRLDGDVRGFIVSNGLVHDTLLQIVKPMVPVLS